MEPTLHPVSPIRARQRLGKYRIVRRISTGGFAEVFEAEDTIEGVRVALRVPRPELVDKALLESFRKEVRLVSRLEHPNILPVKTADLIDGRFVVCSLLGQETLADALERRLSVSTIMAFSEQLLSALAHAHERGVIHRDIKPENVIVFPGNRLRLTDFGIAKVVLDTMEDSGSGTVGYLAPEQALGRPTVRSDVFALGLVLWQMLSGVVPDWPFEWPLPRLDRVRRKVHKEYIEWLRRALHVDQRNRYADGVQMLAKFRKLKAAGQLLPREGLLTKRRKKLPEDWQGMVRKQFERRFRKVLGLNHECARCHSAMGETMRACPRCGNAPARYRGETRMPARCPRCGRGRKLDWRYCAWCYGGGFKSVATRIYPDKKYTGRCANARCDRRQLMIFMRYCPWCRTKVRRRWTFEGADARCVRCDSGVVSKFWKWCPWCTSKIKERT